MNVIETDLPGVLLIEPKVYDDDRGFFVESFQSKRYSDMGIPGPFVQDNHSRSRKGVLRGLHYQLKHPQGKLVRVARGEVFDVAVDVRRDSPYFGCYYSTVLDDKDQRQLYIPPGFAHGFCVLSDVADFEYKCTDYYFPGDEAGIAWDDDSIAIHWPLKDVKISEKDKINPKLKDITMDALPRYRVFS